jgi:hypothetical protein
VVQVAEPALEPRLACGEVRRSSRQKGRVVEQLAGELVVGVDAVILDGSVKVRERGRENMTLMRNLRRIGSGFGEPGEE